MTTIVVDVKNAKVYSDTLISTYHTETVGGESVTNLVKQSTTNYKKMFVFNNYIIVGTGCMNTLERFADNYVNDNIIPPRSDTTIAILSKRQKVVSSIIFDSVEVPLTRWERLLKKPKRYTWTSEYKILDGDWHTFGSGKYIAIGALKAGATVDEAFSITATIDGSTNDDIVCYDIP